MGQNLLRPLCEKIVNKWRSYCCKLIQAEDQVSVKNAKMYPKGISFTANNCALVYLVDEAGARSTTDQFHDLFAGDIVDKLFEESCKKVGFASPGVLGVL